MDVEKLKVLIDKNLTQRDMANLLSCSQSTIKYWLKVFNLKTINTKKYEHIKVCQNEKYCSRCNEIKDKSEFFKKDKKSEVLQSYCKKCNSKHVITRAKDKKLILLTYMGGECVDCNLKVNETNGCVFDFHHLNPKEKDFNLSEFKNREIDEIIKKELDKCVLLCSNCHRMRHSSIV